MMRAVQIGISKYCRTKQSFFCQLMKGIKKNLSASQHGGPQAKKLRSYLRKLKTHYCSRPEEAHTTRCKVFSLLKHNEPQNRQEEQKEMEKTKEFVSAANKAIKHYCVGKSKLMCQVSHDVKRLYLASLKPGKKDLLLNYLVRSQRNFCEGKNKHAARCRMVAVFMKYAKKHRLRPKREHAPMRVIHNKVKTKSPVKTKSAVKKASGSNPQMKGTASKTTKVRKTVSKTRKVTKTVRKAPAKTRKVTKTVRKAPANVQKVTPAPAVTAKPAAAVTSKGAGSVAERASALLKVMSP